MPTFRCRLAIVDARKFEGKGDALNIIKWIEAHDGRANWRGPSVVDGLEKITVYHGKFQWTYVYPGCWVVLNQSGSFTVFHDKDFTEMYEQV